jgi:hypothetical protein
MYGTNDYYVKWNKAGLEKQVFHGVFICRIQKSWSKLKVEWWLPDTGKSTREEKFWLIGINVQLCRNKNLKKSIGQCDN